MNRTLATVVLTLLLLLAIVAPFSALSALMLIVVGTLVYGLVVTLVKAFVTADVSNVSDVSNDTDS
ncbi:MAG: hypothetical protein EDM05_029545 [Leptolyngbya sp. IPPAS B-1204]|nr:hypothetical protein [Elainella sp. C42_A2020_010]RNJ65883.1 MAG: hypothetical protein EDM05_28850 [Leptolyngbya sp. IPPAS B-1204]